MKPSLVSNFYNGDAVTSWSHYTNPLIKLLISWSFWIFQLSFLGQFPNSCEMSIPCTDMVPESNGLHNGESRRIGHLTQIRRIFSLREISSWCPVFDWRNWKWLDSSMIAETDFNRFYLTLRLTRNSPSSNSKSNQTDSRQKKHTFPFV